MQATEATLHTCTHTNIKRCNNDVYSKPLAVPVMPSLNAISYHFFYTPNGPEKITKTQRITIQYYFRTFAFLPDFYTFFFQVWNGMLVVSSLFQWFSYQIILSAFFHDLTPNLSFFINIFIILARNRILLRFTIFS